MTNTATISKAELWELDPNGQPMPNSKVPVQFNPETLKVSFSNQVVPPTNNATDQNSTSTTQYVGKGSTKLAVQLWFDVTGELPEGLAQSDEEKKDVRRLTKKVAYFITPKPAPNDATKNVPPAVRFLWGTFQFDGIMESLEESLEFFSPDGLPLRASLSLNLSQQTIQFAFAQRQSSQQVTPPGARLPSGAAPGTRPLAQAPAGATVPGMAAAQGKGGDWQKIASANNIENPRFPTPGQLIDMNVPRR